MSLRSIAVTGVKWTTFSAGANVFLNFAQTVVLARLLNPVDFGLMGMILVIVGFAQLFSDMGISNAIIYRQDTTKEQLSSLYWLNVMTGVAVFVAVIASKSLIAALYKEPRLEDLMVWAAIVFLITPFGNQFQILLQKHFEFNILAWVGVFGYLASGAVAIVFAYAGSGVYALIWGQLANSTARVVYLIIVSWNKWRPRFHFDRKDLKGYLSFGLYQMGDKTVNYFNSYLIQFLLGSVLGAKALGYFMLAFDMVIKPTLVISPIITRVAYPVFAKLRNDMSRMKSGYMKIQRILSCLNFPVVLGIAAVAPVAVPMIYGEQWIPSVVLVQLLAIVAVLRSMGSPVGPLLWANGKANWGFMWNLGKMIVQVPVLYWSIEWRGVIGGCIALLCVQCIILVLTYMVLVRKVLGRCLKEYFDSLWPSFWMSCTMAVAVTAMASLFNDLPRLPLFVLQILCGFFTYTVFIYCGQNQLLREVKELVWKKR